MLSTELSLKGVCKSYGPVVALHPLSLDLKPGEMVALLGPSGCGKTTTLRIIAGFDTPDYGSVLIGGKDVTELPPNARNLGMVFQSYGLFPHMTVKENVAFGLKMHRTPKAEIAPRVTRILQTVRLEQMADRGIHQLSGGQQQRVAIARALVTNPSILLLDEPMGALDKNLREEMQFELRHLQQGIGITSILVTHDQEEALTMSDRVAVMQAGRIAQIGPPTEIYERPHTRFVSEFLGTSNLFSVVVEAPAGPNRWSVRFADQPGVRTAIECGTGLAVGQTAVIAIRPERLQIAASGPDTLAAELKAVVFRGSYYAYELLIPGRDTPVFVYSQTSVAAGPDGRVGLSWPVDKAVCFPDQGLPVATDPAQSLETVA